MKTNRIVSALLCGAAISAVSSAALAQSAPPADDQAAAQDAPAPDGSETQVEDVVVTGSRVIRNGNNSPTPVTVVQTEELLNLQPTTITDALNNLPVFQGSRGQFSNPNTTGLYGGGNPASNQLNLRNLGSQRTLVLFDGQRLPPSNAIGIVDVDMVPQMLIQRVDVVTGGASAVYGSDAIAGVVNYITDKNFNGLKMEAGYGISDRSDAQNWKFGIAAGTRLFDDRGHVEASYNHYEDDGLPRRNMRDYFQYALLGSTAGSTAVAGSAANPYQVYNGVRNASSSFGGLITNGTLRGYNFTTDGVLVPFVHGTLTGTANQEVGGDGSYGGQNSLKAPLSFDQVFGRFDYEFSDSLKFHAEASGNWKTATTNSANTQFTNLTFSRTNAFLSPATQAALGTAATFTMSKSWNQAPQVLQTAEVQNYFLNAGFEGKLGRFDWGVDANYGYGKIDNSLQYNVNNQRLSAALDAVVNPITGQIVCNASLTNSAYADCKPLNLFGPTASNADAIAYVTSTTHYTPQFDLLDFNAHFGGDLFNLPAGPVVGSVSAEWRKLTFQNGSDATPTEAINCTGLRFNCNANTIVWVNAFAVGPEVSQTVKEGAAEFNAPLLKDLPFIQALNLNGALRYTSYDYGGNNWTWKLGLDWHITDEVRIRATSSKDIQAPSLSQLFQPVLLGSVTMQDRLTGTNPAIKIANIGNPDLVSETARNETLGVIWKPAAIPGFSASIDAYRIRVDGALTQLQGYNPQLQDACYASGGTSFYCTLQTRPNGFADKSATNAVTQWTAVFANISGIETYGVDVEVNYATEVSGHPLTGRFFTTFQPHYTISQPGLPTYDEGNVAFPNVVPLQAMPALRITSTVNYGVTDNFFVSLTGRYRGEMTASAVSTDVYVPKDQTVPHLFVADANFLYRRDAGQEIYFNVRNIFDKMPFGTAGLSAGSGYPQIDDPTGRFYSFGVRVKF